MSTVIEWQRGMCVAKAQLVPQSTAYNPDNVLAKTFAHYQQCLHHSKKAHDYLQTRGLFDKTLLQALGQPRCDSMNVFKVASTRVFIFYLHYLLTFLTK